MDNDLRNTLIGGALLPIVAWVWGISSLLSREVVLSIRRYDSLPIYDHLTVRGWPATCISIALLAGGLALHSICVWGRFPRYERAATAVAWCAGYAAGILFTIGIIYWSLGSLAGVFR
jgi:hypothetical protein